MWNSIQNFIASNYNGLIELLNINEKYLEELAISSGKAILIIVIGFIISRILYTQTIKIFRKYNFKNKIDRFESFLESDEEIKEGIPEEKQQKKLTERIKLDIVAGKSISYYVFLFFFKQSLIVLGVEEVAKSLNKLLEYLPNLFIGIVIGFFGIRFANFIYDITYHTLSIAESNSKTKTSKIIATGSKGIILFLTFMLVLDFTKLIKDEFLTIIIIGFISMLSIAGGIAFGLGGKDIAKDILEKFNKED